MRDCRCDVIYNNPQGMYKKSALEFTRTVAMAPYIGSFLFALLSIHLCNSLSYYDYFVPDGVVNTGLVAEGDDFTLNDKEILILSGALHYFRVHPSHWRDTLKKIRAAGMNAVETYVPWNLHEPRQNVYDFGDLGEDMSAFLDVRSFIQMAQEEDLFVILRPGPYICAEWEFGGMPSWLLRDPNMEVRTSYEGFKTPLEVYFNNLLPRLVDLQFTRGGPIIAVQIENEYGNFGYPDVPHDKEYLEAIKDILTANGFSESLYFTSDTPLLAGDSGALPGVLMTANFNTYGEENLSLLKEMQPDRPLMVMEFWTGWFDHWLAPFHVRTPVKGFGEMLELILSHNSSVNMYMFIGGTSFGFMAGANTLDIWPHYTPQTSTYDYDAPLSEAGDYTEKYILAKDIMARYNPLEGVVDHPEQPPQRVKASYPEVAISESLDFATLLSQQNSVETDEGTLSMELLPFNEGNGQSYGYVVYTAHATLTPNSSLQIINHVRDMAQVLVDGVVMTKPYGGLLDVSSFGFWNGQNKSLAIPGQDEVAEVMIMVENLGRVNFGRPHKYHQQKGLWEGPVLIDGIQVDQWIIHSMELKGSQVTNLTGWIPFAGPLETPAMYRGVLHLDGPPQDTFLDMSGWNKGVVFVNGFNLGRYWVVGPPKTLYLPAPFLREGNNQIIAFEQYAPGPAFVFRDTPILG
ncbi:beta-galactosidase-1-like protein 2 [Palaemon carinicauda]|uniref:beta-galactosidase-1-like protein 2 n=1 Tax=Palaemon carinicauda TaxID=392227 RepID=UPI0035B63203